MGCIKLQENDIPTCFEFINGFSLLLIGTTNGSVYFINFIIKNNSLLFNLEAVIDLGKKVDRISSKKKKKDLKLEVELEVKNKEAEYPEKLLLDFGLSNSNLFIKGQELENPAFYEDFKVYLATNSGNVRVYNISSLFKDNKFAISEHSCLRANYNAFRYAKEDFYKQKKFTSDSIFHIVS